MINTVAKRPLIRNWKPNETKPPFYPILIAASLIVLEFRYPVKLWRFSNTYRS